MKSVTYLAVLAFIVAGTAWLPWATGAVVWRKTRRLLLSLIAPVLAFTVWDVYAVRRSHWSFDPQRVLSMRLFGLLPIEELLFFIVIPLASVLTLEAVRAMRGWQAGDEP
ncbi:MAG: lycopene cyclase domain-containing protein [Actinomycetales bacterium]|nr:lycopene cyclase domain-containing protein [Actinomycetales bacterium]